MDQNILAEDEHCIMEEPKISDKKEVENVSIENSSEKMQTILLPSYTKSYSKTWIESTTFEYTWEINQFSHLCKSIDKLCSPLFPETAEHKIQMNVRRDSQSRKNYGNQYFRVATQFYLLTTKPFTGSCTTTIIFPHKTKFKSNEIWGGISNMALLIDILEDDYMNHKYTSTDTLKIQCKLEIFHKQISDTIHMNLQSYSTVFSKDMGSLEDSTLDESDNKSQDKKSIKFIVGKETYVIPKELLHATNSSYFKDVCLTHEGKEKDMTNELIDIDFEPALQEMLVFIQTGSIRSNEYNMLKNLFIIADDYDVLNLKLTCENYLLRNITIYNATELIQLAFWHEAELLKTHSAAFIKLYGKEIMNTKTFQNLPQESANEIMELIDKSKVLEISTGQFYSSPAHSAGIYI